MINEKIKGRCAILAEIINNIKETYATADTNQKALIETMIGAALWYIPKPKNTWSGMISIEAIKSFLPTNITSPKLSEEHVIPRKIAALELLNHKEYLTPEFKHKVRQTSWISPKGKDNRTASVACC